MIRKRLKVIFDHNSAKAKEQKFLWCKANGEKDNQWVEKTQQRCLADWTSSPSPRLSRFMLTKPSNIFLPSKTSGGSPFPRKKNRLICCPPTKIASAKGADCLSPQTANHSLERSQSQQSLNTITSRTRQGQTSRQTTSWPIFLGQHSDLHEVVSRQAHPWHLWTTGTCTPHRWS